MTFLLSIGIPGRWTGRSSVNDRVRRVLLWGAYVITTILVNFGLATSVVAERADLLRLHDGTAMLRTAPALDAPIVMALNADHKLLSLGESDGWRKVAVFREVGKVGWVEAEKLERYVAEPAPTPEIESAPARRDEQFLLDIDGSPAMAYRGECDVVGGPEPGRGTFEGLVPHQYIMTGHAVTCRVRKFDSAGRLRVALLHAPGGDDYRHEVAYAGTALPFNWVRVQSDGPWGYADGYAGPVFVKRRGRSPTRFDLKTETDVTRAAKFRSGRSGTVDTRNRATIQVRPTD